MTDPKRLLNGSQSPRTRALLRAGQAEASPDGFSQRLLASVASAAAASAMTGAAAASLGTGAKLGGTVMGAASGSGAASGLVLVTAKWVAVGVLGGGLLAAGADLLLSPPAPERAPIGDRAAAAASPVPAKTPVAQASAPTRAEPAAAPSAPVPSTASEPDRTVVTAPSTVRSSQLGREVELIDRVRRALAAGNTSLALSELDSYARMSSTGVLDREARVLRIQALRDAGDVAGAQQLTARYLADFPNDAHALRLRGQEAHSAKPAP